MKKTGYRRLGATAYFAAVCLFGAPAVAQTPAPFENQPDAPAAENADLDTTAQVGGAGPAVPAPQQAPSSPEETDPEALSPEDTEDRSALILEQLMGEAPEDDDLEWLYSDLDEYAPSDLGGSPIPAPGLPSRGEGTRRVWDPRWRRFGLGNYILTGVGFAGSAASTFLSASPDRWRSRNALDEWGRRTLSITSSYQDSYWAQDVSDVLLSVTVAYPLLLDSLIVTYWYRRSTDVAVQIALISAEAMAVSTALHGLTAGLASRERPYGRDCGGVIDPNLGDCAGKKRFRSFFSGHTTLSFAGAAVSCSHHARHAIFGDPLADALSCAVGLATATGTGLFRIVGNQHYVTDVLVGAGVGTLGGLGIPWLLHYGPLARVSGSKDEQAAFSWRIMPVGNGIGLGGQF